MTDAAKHVLNNNARLSKVERIVHAIIMDIESGELKYNQQLLSINEYSKKYGVARDTIEKAYIKLKNEDYIAAISGKGYFVLGKRDTRLRVLFVLNKLSSYKKETYDAFVHTLGDNARVDIFVHHYSPALLKECLQVNAGKYHYYVIMPHFFYNADEKEYLDALETIPPNQLILLDKNLPKLDKVKSAVYQDFKNDIYDSLNSVVDLVKKYKSLTVIFPEHANHPMGINEGVMQFCFEQKLKFSVISHPDNEQLINHNLYIILTESDLAILIKKIRQSENVLGTDIGIISFNETVFKELLDITVISTDFEEMGKTTARLILNKEQALIRNPFKLIQRNSL